MDWMDILEARMTPEYPAFHLLYPLSLRSDEAQSHLQYHVLHRKIRRHAANMNDFVRLSFAFGARKEVKMSGFVDINVGRGDPLSFAIVFI